MLPTGQPTSQPSSAFNFQIELRFLNKTDQAETRWNKALIVFLLCAQNNSQVVDLSAPQVIIFILILLDVDVAGVSVILGVSGVNYQECLRLFVGVDISTVIVERKSKKWIILNKDGQADRQTGRQYNNSIIAYNNTDQRLTWKSWF